VSEPISVGDLVVAVGVCCAQRDFALGRVGRVVSAGETIYCNDCCGYKGVAGSGFYVPDARSCKEGGYFEAAWLKRIPPLSELEGQPTQEDIKEPA
jgi:hypothetical protein